MAGRGETAEAKPENRTELQPRLKLRVSEGSQITRRNVKTAALLIAIADARLDLWFEKQDKS